MNPQDYFIDQLNKYNKEKVQKDKSIALIGLGPHAKRIYLNYFKKHKINLALVVDLKSQEVAVKKYLKENGFKNTKVYCIDDKFKDNEHMPELVEQNLLAICETMEITHIVISTEPKGHFMYLEFALKHNIHVLTDKPISVTKNMTNVSNINKVRKQYYELLNLSKKSNSMCKVMCQRQYHKGYEYIKQILNETVKKYQVPITYISIYHCDGNWEMPHDLLKENHPYKYGYGKLFHSGYHFIDLLSDFLKINNQLPSSKQITNGEVYSNCMTPNDEIGVFNIEDYKRMFKNQKIPQYYEENLNPKFNKFGEKNFYGFMDFRNSYNQLITHVDLNLLHYGFSRRGWIESKDYYKHNGRIRHESINIQVGTLLNIQVHSYQSKEIKDRKDMIAEEQVGGLEHFDIDIYRNVDIIGGKPFERIKLGDLYSEKEKKDILGYNELSREVYLTNFFKGNCKKGDIKNQALAIEILYSCALGLHNYYKSNKKPIKIDMKNKNIYPINLEELKKNEQLIDKVAQKKLINEYVINHDGYDFGIMMNYLKEKNKYEIYMYISDDKKAASGLFLKNIKNHFISNLYFKYLKRKAKKLDLFKISYKANI